MWDDGGISKSEADFLTYKHNKENIEYLEKQVSTLKKERDELLHTKKLYETLQDAYKLLKEQSKFITDRFAAKFDDSTRLQELLLQTVLKHDGKDAEYYNLKRKYDNSNYKIKDLVSKLEKLIDNCDYHYVGNVQGAKIIYADDVIEVIDKFKKSIDN